MIATSLGKTFLLALFNFTSANAAIGEAILLAFLIFVPGNVFILVQWARGRDVAAGRITKGKMIAVSCPWLVLAVAALSIYHYYLGESVEIVVLTGGIGLLFGGGVVAVAIWQAPQRIASGKVRQDPPVMM